MLPYNTVSACDGFYCINDLFGYDSYQILNTVNLSFLIILVIGLIIISFLTYRKHKSKKGLWRNILKNNMIFIFILFFEWIIVNFFIWYMAIL